MALGSQIVLLSGGWESVACLLKATANGRATGMFFDYGQPYLSEEKKAIAALSAHVDFDLVYVTMKDMERNGKVFVDRNLRFLNYAMRFDPVELWMGARAPLHLFDKYRDSNWQFAQEMGRVLGVTIRTPLICWPKLLVKYYVTKHGIPEDIIFSSEGYNYEPLGSN